MIPDKIKFINGPHQGLIFTRGTGPAEDRNIGGGISFTANAPYCWYDVSSTRCVMPIYMITKPDDWEEAS